MRAQNNKKKHSPKIDTAQATVTFQSAPTDALPTSTLKLEVVV